MLAFQGLMDHVNWSKKVKVTAKFVKPLRESIKQLKSHLHRERFAFFVIIGFQFERIYATNILDLQVSFLIPPGSKMEKVTAKFRSSSYLSNDT